MSTTVEDLLEAGFVPYQVWAPDRETSLYKVQTMPGQYVHSSVADNCRKIGYWQKEHPVVCFEIGRGWVANWGAVQFNVDTWHKLLQFCKTFGFDVSIDAQESHL